MSSGTSLFYGKEEITVKDILYCADHGRSPLNRAIVVRAVNENVISAKDIRKHFRFITNDVLKQWSLDGEVIAFFPKILGAKQPEKEAPPIPSEVSHAVLPALLTYRELSLDADKGKLWWNERSVLLSYREKVALPLFFHAPETVITREAIHEEITKRPYEKGVTLPDQVMTDARASFRTLGITPLPILKVRGGYKLTISH